MERLYIDTNVYISHLDNEFGGITRNLGLYSGQLFRRVLSCEFSIIASNLVIRELSRVLKDDASTLDFFTRFRKAGKLEWVFETDNMHRRAKMLSKKHYTHKADLMHAVLAEEANATLVTWNIKDFEGLPVRLTSPAFI